MKPENIEKRKAICWDELKKYLESVITEASALDEAEAVRAYQTIKSRMKDFENYYLDSWTRV